MMMEAFKVKKDLWTFKLAPQLTGKAQQAFTAMDKRKTNNYQAVKNKRYDSSKETYHQRFWSAKKMEVEGYLELATRLQDLLEKWMAGCRSGQGENCGGAILGFYAKGP